MTTPPPLPPLPQQQQQPQEQLLQQPLQPQQSGASLPSPPGSTPLRVPEVPADLASKPAHVLEDFLTRPKAIHGLIHTLSPEIEAKHAAQLQATGAITQTRAPALLARIDHELPPLRDAAAQALAAAKLREAEWVTVETDMYKALQRFSLPALQARMDMAVAEAEQICDGLGSSFLEAPHGAASTSSSSSGGAKANLQADDAEVAAFVKQYRRERKTYYMRKEIQERWKEERVGRAF
ncbi:hypothetical protein D0Z00_002112 [Geotrichum galactomycetum]|uniref:Uncharacterized protein n=1 Tax=Geotrichum galactomycetum TaxID=27317 RepID=A0ACB6V585_9ASCO|nr:hypothetical protein D0Z00_002112 [Geotrichum candidum]